MWPSARGEEFQPIHELWRSKVPDAETVHVQALAVAERMRERRRMIGKLDNRAAAREALLPFDGIASERLDWDEACQVLHGLAALERTRLALRSRQRVQPEFALAFDKLLLPRSANSPHGYDPAMVRRDLDGLIRDVRLGLREELKP